MSDFTLHGVSGSPYARAVLLALEEKKADYRFAVVPLGGNRLPDYMEIHPFQKIPTLDHGEFRLYETHAILRYIDREADGPALVPEGSKPAARMDQLLSFATDYLTRRVTSVLTFNRFIRPLLGLEADEEAVREGIAPAREVLAELARLLGDKAFLAADVLSLADLMIAPHLAMLRDFAEGRELLADQPTLEAWLKRMSARSSMCVTSQYKLA